MSRMGAPTYRARHPWKRTYQPARHPWLLSGSSIEAWGAFNWSCNRRMARLRIQGILRQAKGYGRG